MTKLTIEYSILETFKPFLLGYCNCGCGGSIKVLFYGKRPMKYIQGHEALKGDKHPKWKGGIHKHDLGYEKVRIPGHHRASKWNKLVYRHIVIYEQYHKCCVLKWAQIHHINGIKNDNRVENLQLVSKAEHNRITFFVNTSGRKCSQCGTDKVYMDKRGKPVWHWLDKKLLCGPCYRRITYKRNKKHS